MTTATTKLKVLLVGSIGNHVATFVSKLRALQKSKAGPFDICFVVGPVDQEILIAQNDFPLPVYLQDCTRLTLPIETTISTDEPTRLSHNLFGFSIGNIYRISTNKTSSTATPTATAISELIICSIPPRATIQDLPALSSTLHHVSYVGCDILLSSEWPQGMEQVIPKTIDKHIDIDIEIGSFDVAHIALHARPRYHIAPSLHYQQSNPFTHLPSSSSTTSHISHVGRFIALAPVTNQTTTTTTTTTYKPPKSIHALGLTPLHSMTMVERNSIPTNVQPNPYTDASYQRDGDTTTTTNTTLGLSEAQARRIMGEMGQQDYRWGTNNNNNKKRQPNYNNNNNDDDETITTLFLHGLHKDVSNKLQTGSIALLQAFEKYKVEKVRRPPAASSYAFLEFQTHADAKNCLDDLAGEITVMGIHLTLKWASQGSTTTSTMQQHNMQQPSKRPRLTEQDAKGSSTLYFRLPPRVLTDEITAISEQLRTYMETMLETALGDPDVTAKNEPALQVKLRLTLPSTFGFLEFASHAAASMVLATGTGTTDGGSLVTIEEITIPDELLGVMLYWAPEPNKTVDNTMMTASGVVFSRQHFPVDSRSDCWFCLASPGCEKHLITSVFQQCYLAMPKGPIHPGHILIVPVTHTSQGALADSTLQDEIADLKQRLYRHAKEKYQCELFVWERAIQTKGGYHTHLQCVPVAPDIVVPLQATIVALARKAGFALREINSDLGLQALSDTEEGYFYAEIMSRDTKRFLHPSIGSSRVPLQFGREILAVVMDQPDLAHWKACVLDKDKEQELAMEFRKSFEKYEPTEE